MELFTYKELYEEDGKRILEVNVLPEKYCNFDCPLDGPLTSRTL